MVEPPPQAQAQAWASALPYADVLAPQLDLFWALREAPSNEWRRKSQQVAAVGKELEELDDTPAAWAHFVELALLPQLDALATWSSDADGALQQTLLRLLYVRFGAVLQARQVAALVRVVPGRDPFDATVHKAQGAAEGPAGVVMRVLRVGLRDHRSGERIRAAEVLVGQSPPSR